MPTAYDHFPIPVDQKTSRNPPLTFRFAVIYEKLL